MDAKYMQNGLVDVWLEGEECRAAVFEWHPETMHLMIDPNTNEIIDASISGMSMPSSDVLTDKMVANVERDNRIIERVEEALRENPDLEKESWFEL